MSEQALLVAENLGKSFPLHSDPQARIRALWRLLAGASIERSNAVAGLNFTIKPGESLGIIGENGAGKSTLLKLLCGVLTPSSGKVTRTGNIGALLELGAGFDPEQSGRSNIGLAAGLLGWSNAQIKARSDEIIEFAGIGRYIDEPVKHYSSGMVVRLGFAIVAAVRPALLITDEVLAVGDESFQKKCIRWIEDYLDTGGTLLLVSHSMYHVQKLCKQALWLKDGAVQAYGDVFDVTQDYLAYHERKSATQIEVTEVVPDYSGADYRITRVVVDGNEASSPLLLGFGHALHLEVDIYRPDNRLPQFSIGIVRADGSAVFGTTSEIEGILPIEVDPEHVRYTLRFDALPLLPGAYTLKLMAMDPEGMRLFDSVERGLTVRGQSREFGVVRLSHRWE